MPSLKNAFLSALLPSLASCANLIVSSYAGTLTSIAIPEDLYGDITSHIKNVNKECGASPSWVVWDAEPRIGYCLNEAIGSANGSVSSFSMTPDGTLKVLSTAQTGGGPVHGQLVGGKNNRTLVIADYSGAAVESIALIPSWGVMAKLSYAQLEMVPGRAKSDPVRQASPHPHQVVLDPTGEFIIVPDLGNDLIRVFKLSGQKLVPWPIGFRTASDRRPALGLRPLTGPRHVVFVTYERLKRTVMFVLGELNNMIMAFEVKYEDGIMVFTFTAEYATFGDLATPVGTFAGEIIISPDKHYLYVSNRGDQMFQRGNDTNDLFEKYSDSISTFGLYEGGYLVFSELRPAGGLLPRHMALNRNADVLAVAVQKSGRVMFFRRYPNGAIGELIAHAFVEGATSVTWDE